MRENWMNCRFLMLTALLFLCPSPPAYAAGATTTPSTSPAPDAAVEKQASDIVKSLDLTDAGKAQRVHDVLVTHFRAVRDWHNAQMATLATTKPSAKEQMEVDRKIDPAERKRFLDGLAADLTPEQVELVKDKITVGKVAFTLRGYHAIVPDLTAEEEAHILGLLKQAREESLDVKNMVAISAVFEVYKTQAEQYLISHGRDWRKLYKDYVAAQNARKAAATATGK
jgi:hypothetical protein